MEKLTESACVLIDGPKGDRAIKIALKILKKMNVVQFSSTTCTATHYIGT
jgi:hypothetical protein